MGTFVLPNVINIVKTYDLCTIVNFNNIHSEQKQSAMTVVKDVRSTSLSSTIACYSPSLAYAGSFF